MADMPQEAPAEPQGDDSSGGGGASQLIADTHTNLLKLQELVSSKFPEDGDKLAQIVQAFQQVVDELGQGPGQGQAPAQPATSSPEAGGADVKPVY